MSVRLMEVVTRTIETPSIVSFELRPVDGLPLPQFRPGAHVDVYVAEGVVRQYSLTNGPADKNEYSIAVKREPHSRGGSSTLHDIVKVGDRLAVGEPRNLFELVSHASFHVLIGGGIGITPLLSMSRHLADSEKFALHYFAASNVEIAFSEKLSELPHGTKNFHIGLAFDQVEDTVRSLLSEQDLGAHLYVCGPGPFMDLVLTNAKSFGWISNRVHLERFAPVESSGGADVSFEVELVKQGRTLTVNADETIAQALIRDGIECTVSCEQGMCGICLTEVIGGIPEHRDSFLTDAERDANDRMCLCVSRARGAKLVLNI